MNHTRRGRLTLSGVLLTLCIPLVLLLFSSGLRKNLSQQELSMARESVRRAAVECYALEGFYPGDLDYLRAHYGLSLNEQHYFVDYQYIGSNLMPDITVFHRTQ